MNLGLDAGPTQLCAVNSLVPVGWQNKKFHSFTVTNFAEQKFQVPKDVRTGHFSDPGRSRPDPTPADRGRDMAGRDYSSVCSWTGSEPPVLQLTGEVTGLVRTAALSVAGQGQSRAQPPSLPPHSPAHNTALPVPPP